MKERFSFIWKEVIETWFKVLGITIHFGKG